MSDLKLVNSVVARANRHHLQQGLTRVTFTPVKVKVKESMEEKMFRTVILLPLFFLLLVEFETEAKAIDLPISPKKYQDMIHTGFNTNWFKRKDPMQHYSEQIIKDVRDKGFSNLRLRCRADLYSYNYSAANFTIHGPELL